MKNNFFYNKKNFFIFFIFLSAFFLRIYKLPQTTMFLSDQGRDAIIAYEIITFKHWPAIGAPTSIGQVYLGPFYYYLIAPFLLIFNFNPVGLAFAIAFFSSVFIVFSFLIIKKTLNWSVAFLFSFITSFSFINIEQSRFSWNPNLLPFFSFFSFYFFYKFINEKQLKWMVLFGTFFSLSIQLHYLAFLNILPIVFYFLYQLIKSIRDKKQLKAIIFNYLAAFLSFSFFSIPLLIFDLRHNFLNSKNFIKLFTQDSLINQNNRIFPFLNLIIFYFVFLFLKRKKINEFILIHFLNAVLFIWGFEFLNAPSHLHYFGGVYLSFFLLISYLIEQLRNIFPKKLFNFLLVFFLSSYFLFNFKHWEFLWQKVDGQIEHSKKVADFLAKKIDNKPYNIATWPVEFGEDNYLYFLILKGLKPANRQKVEITNQMFVLCQKQPCLVTNSPSWNISMFGKAKIDKIWKFEGLFIYKLIHEK